MTTLNKEAQSLNNEIFDSNTALFSLLSAKGKKTYFPSKGILAQSAEAKGKQTNATIGIALEDDNKPIGFDSIKQRIDLNLSDIFPYTSSFGKLELREKWNKLIQMKNPSLCSDTSLPIVTNGITHGLSIIGHLFADPNDKIILSDMYWSNYRIIFENWIEASLETFNTFQNSSLDLTSFENKLARSNGKTIIILNFPNNPSGYTPSIKEIEDIVKIIENKAKSGCKILVICDDAYFGLVYEENIFKESIFSLLADLNENVVAVKLDGATKEDYVWGFRIGFITFGCKNLSSNAYEALEKKTAGAIRSNISSACHLSQSLLLKAFESADYDMEKKQKYELLKSRYEKVKKVLENDKYERYFSALPFNSGYFMCLKLADDIDAEQVRLKLLKKYDTGVINSSGLLRLAFSSVSENKIESLFENIYSACIDCKSF